MTTLANNQGAAALKNKHLGSRALSLFLSLCLCAGLFVTAPTAAYAATGSILMNGVQTVSNLSSDGNGTGWSWTASSNTLTLDSNYSGDPIRINCTSGDTINIVVSDTVSVTASSSDNAQATAIFCTSSLSISGTGVLTASSNYGNSIRASGNISITGGTVNSTSTFNGGDAISSTSGSLTISNDAAVSASATAGSSSVAINFGGGISISTTGTVTAVSGGIFGIQSNGTISISGTGSVSATGTTHGINGSSVNISNGRTTSSPVVQNSTLNFTGGLYNGVTVAPANASATAGNGQASVTFDAPNNNMGAITGYTVTSSPGGFTGTGTTSPITVTGLTNGTAYTFTVTATTAGGTSSPSIASNSVTPAQVIDIAAIIGVVPPLTGNTPMTSITETLQYTGSVSWSPLPSGTFAGGTTYTATITLSPKTGYTFTGVIANYFTVSGATTVSNPASSGVITAVFPATATPPAITSVNNKTITYGTADTLQVETTGTTPMTFSLSGTVPSGVSIGSSTGLLAFAATVASDTYTFTVTAANGTLPDASQTFTLTVNEAPGADVSGAPTVNGTPTASSITVNAVTNAGVTGQAVEYAISTSNSPVPTSGWQSSTTFNGLDDLTTYYVFARTAANTNYNAGTSQVSAAIETPDDPVQSSQDIAEAKDLIESTPFSTTQTSVDNEVAAKDFVKSIIDGLALKNVVTTINTVSYLAPIAGTKTNPSGTNGSYTFTVSLSKGAGTPDITSVLVLVIIATPYVTYPVLEDFDTYSGSGTISARIDHDPSDFVRLIYDKTGAEVSLANYTISQGSTIITLTEAYAKSFAPGTYYFTAEYAQGQSVPIKLVIPTPGSNSGDPSSLPGTGDSSLPQILLASIFAVAALAMFTVAVRRRRSIGAHKKER